MWEGSYGSKQEGQGNYQEGKVKEEERKNTQRNPIK